MNTYEIYASNARTGSIQITRKFESLNLAVVYAKSWVKTTCCAGCDAVQLCVGNVDNLNNWDYAVIFDATEA